MNNILYIIILSIILGVILVAYRHYHGPYTKAFGFDLSKLKPWHWNIIVIVVLLLNLYAWLPEIYKWVDDEGNVHYGEKLPNNATGKAVETIKTKDSVSTDIQASEDAYKAGDYEVAFRLIKLLAEQGDTWAQYKIGQMFDEGKGVTQDYKEAVKWYRLAAEQGDADAQNSLGYMYQNGEGVTKDDKEAEKWYRLAAKQGDARAQSNLGVMYQNGEGVTKDDKEAEKWYRLAAKQGLAHAQFNLGQMYVKGQGVTQDYKEATKWWRLAAEQGDVEAQYNLGVIYSQGPTQDYKEAIKWYRLAAAQGFVGAQYNLAVMYIFGQGVIKNHVVAHMWTNIAARNGHEAAKKSRDVLAKKMTPEQITKAEQLARECIKKNYKDCVSSSLNIEKAPNKTTDKTVETIKTKDSVSADFQEGLDAYKKGDYETASKIYRAAAEQGHAKAQNNLGRMYELNKVAQDFKEAAKWYHLAAIQGDVEAQSHLGYMYIYGKGVTKNLIIAYMWLSIAANDGNKKGRQYKYFVENKMTVEQIAKAEQLARECIKKNYKDCVSSSLNIEKAPNKTTDKTVETIKTKDETIKTKDSVSADSQAGFDAYKKGDYETALKIYRAAAEQGDIMAQFHLGGMYLTGKGVTQDYKQTVKWWRLAAEQGEDIAQFNLGRMYVKGQGVTRNLVIAHMWFNTATFNNFEAWTPSMSLRKNKNLSEEDFMKNWRKMKKKEVGRLESEMTSEQIAEAKELARDCIKKNYKDCG